MVQVHFSDVKVNVNDLQQAAKSNVFLDQSEEEKMVMKNKVIKAKEQAANLLMTSQQTQQERDELMRKLERAKVMEQYNNVVQISNENSVDEDNVSI